MLSNTEAELKNSVAYKKKCVRSSYLEVFLGKGVLKICSKFTGEHPCQGVISIKLQSNFIEIALRYGCSPVICCTLFRKNTSGWVFLMCIPARHFSLDPLTQSALWSFARNTKLPSFCKTSFSALGLLPSTRNVHITFPSSL